MRLVIAQVTKAHRTRNGVQRLSIEYPDAKGKYTSGEALRYDELAPLCEEGDSVLINTTAVDLGLGTGGRSPVLANLSAIERGGPIVFDDPAPGGGHIMKLRYTPLQHEVLSVEEPASPFHGIMDNAISLKGTPVICCELHSQVPLVATALKYKQPGARLVYCMTDEAALLAAFSTLLVQMRTTGLLDASITCGQAFGGDLEAVNLYSGMLAASAVCEADVIICSQGPGLVGTATRFGHGGLSQATALNAASVLDGVPIATLRVSFADARLRHHGVSHHSLTALGRVCLAKTIVPFPASLTPEQAELVERQLQESGITTRHEVVKVDFNEKDIDLFGLEVTTMGRTQSDDPAFFSASFAAGVFAAQLLDTRQNG
ncbi:MAG: DUF3866 family protein [Coriobacteriia bacterium]|nr:DUF3866 family protein [Coriobacteriia bacterium]